MRFQASISYHIFNQKILVKGKVQNKYTKSNGYDQQENYKYSLKTGDSNFAGQLLQLEVCVYLLPLVFLNIIFYNQYDLVQQEYAMSIFI